MNVKKGHEGNVPLIKLRPLQSICVVTITLVETAEAHITQVRVITANTPPDGTSGVLIVVIVETYSSKSRCTVSFLISHLVSFLISHLVGPTEALSGLVYDMFQTSSLDVGDVCALSDIWMSVSS